MGINKQKAWFSICQGEKEAMVEKMDGITILFIEKCLVAIEDCWKEKENMQQKKIEALLSTIEAL